MAELPEITLFTSKLLHDIAPNPLRGGQLSVLLKTTFPGFDPLAFGARNLRDFVASNIPNAVEIGRAGTDILYGLRQEQQQLFADSVDDVGVTRSHRNAPLDQLLDNPRIWRTFASPDSEYQLYLLPDGKLRVLRSFDEPGTNWFRIPPITGEALLTIAKDFIVDLPAAQQTPLLKCLSGAKWWIPFFEVLRDLGLKTRWISFRRRRIVAEFERSLLSAPAPMPPSPPIDLNVAAPATIAPTRGQAVDETTVDSMRRIALSVVGRMTETELRSLNFPLGYVMDVVLK